MENYILGFNCSAGIQSGKPSIRESHFIYWLSHAGIQRYFSNTCLWLCPPNSNRQQKNCNTNIRTKSTVCTILNRHIPLHGHHRASYRVFIHGVACNSVDTNHNLTAIYVCFQIRKIMACWRITIGSNRSLRSLGRAKARPLTKR